MQINAAAYELLVYIPRNSIVFCARLRIMVRLENAICVCWLSSVYDNAQPERFESQRYAVS